MKALAKPGFIRKQRGLVLFFALIALLALSLAAVALVRSVDTGTLIAGNLAFRQAATTSGDAGIEAAVAWLAATELANAGVNVLNNPAHTFNTTNTALAPGYYSNANDVLGSVGYLNLFAAATWAGANSVLVLPDPDGSGNTIRYVIQRMCRTANLRALDADCLFSAAADDGEGGQVQLSQQICTPAPGAPCPLAGQSPQVRITTRTTGPKNTVSYLQAFVY